MIIGTETYKSMPILPSSMYHKAAKEDNKQMVCEPESLKVGSPVIVTRFKELKNWLLFSLLWEMWWIDVNALTLNLV